MMYSDLMAHLDVADDGAEKLGERVAIVPPHQARAQHVEQLSVLEKELAELKKEARR